MSGCLVQSGFGTVGNFEFLYPNAVAGLDHYWRDNDDPARPWHHSGTFGQALGQVGRDRGWASMIYSSYGNLEVVVVRDGGLYYFSRGQNGWEGPTNLADGVTGVPGIVQRRNHGNFEVVVPLDGGGIVHLTRDNGDPERPWSWGSVFGSEQGEIDSVSLIESHLGPEGNNLEVVAWSAADGAMHHYWGHYGDVPAGEPTWAPAVTWSGPDAVPSADGVPSLVQGNFGQPGNFELVVTDSEHGGLTHYYRDNGAEGFPWPQPGTPFGERDDYGVPSLIKSNDSHLEVVVYNRSANSLVQFRRDGAWSEPSTVAQL